MHATATRKQTSATLKTKPVYGARDVPFVRKSYIVAHLDASVRREIDAVQFPFETDLTIVSISNELRKKVASDLEDIISFA